MPIPFAQLPEDLRRYIKGAETRGNEDIPSEEVLSAIGVAIGNLWEEAKNARVSSGIERRWRDAEDAYAGIDDANRGEMSGASQWEKSMSPQGPVQTARANLEDGDSKSTLYFLLTPRYVDAGVAKLCEILLAPGAKSFSFSATPLPDLIQAKEDNRPVLLDHLPGSPPAMRPALPEEATQIGAGGTPSPLQGAVPVPAPAAGAPDPSAGAVQISMPGQPMQAQPMGPMVGHNGGPPMVPVRVKDLAKEAAEQADKAAKKVEKRVYDWMVECHRSSQVRKVAFDSGRLGVGVLKGPYPRKSKQMATLRDRDMVQLKIREVIKPASKWVNAWNFFPDPACGENIQDGEYVFEREWMTERQLRALKKMPGYIRRKIDQVIAEGPQKVNVSEGSENRSPQGQDDQTQKGKYEVKFFYGTLTREEMGIIHDAADYGSERKPTLDELAPPEREQVYVIATTINDSVVRATVNPLDSGEFPYHAMPWQRRSGSWAGKGIAEQMDTPQRVANASLRSLLDNAGVSAGGQIIIDLTKVTPADGIMAMSPHKIWYANGDEEAVDVREAMQMFEIPNHTNELMAIFDKAMMMAEESTSIPLITQGQSGPTTPETYGGMQLQNSNAQQLLRSVGYTFDDTITVPETDQYYEWAMLDPEVPNDEKGDWTIDAHGSPALIEKALQNQFIAQMGPLVKDPAYGANPRKWFGLLLEANHLNPTDIQYTEEEQAKVDAAASQVPSAPVVEAAKLRIAFEEKKLQTDSGLKAKDMQDNVQVELETLKLKERIAMLEYANREKTTLDKVKADLAGTAMKLEAQERLSARDQAIGLKRDREKQPPRGEPRRQPARQVLTPPTEPVGRARNGAAYQA